MALHPLAGKPAPAEALISVDDLLKKYFDYTPNVENPTERVSFGTSGHRGTSTAGSFNELHIAATTQAICEYREMKGVDGPLFMGMDTHALSLVAQKTAIEVLAANGVSTKIQEKEGFTPTPVISHAILTYNKGRKDHLADGIVVTPSHNPPQDGGFKYNPPHGGPADTDATNWIQDRANALLKNISAIKRIPFEKAVKKDEIQAIDYVTPYVNDLKNVIDIDSIVNAKLKFGVDPLGGAAVGYWGPIAETYGLDIEVVNPAVDSQFKFMTLDHDGKIRMDCSSPYAMQGLLKYKDKFSVAFGNDPDGDRHGIVTPGAGLLNPNHYLAVVISYLCNNRPQWSKDAAIGKTLVSSQMIDRVVNSLGRKLVEVPVGFKWFVEGLHNGTCAFGGEESAGASFLRKDGTTWSTDKDGIILNLLACEITSVTGKDPGEIYGELKAKFGDPVYTRVDTPTTPEVKAKLKKLSSDMIKADTLAGDAINGIFTHAPGNNAAIGGLKVSTSSGWFAARPSGTENIYKVYAESFKDKDHLDKILSEAQDIVNGAIG